MRSLIGTFGLVPRIMVAVIAVSAFPWHGLAQSSQTSQQPPDLGDPTPRPIDLHKLYNVDPVERARQQQLMLVKKAQLKQQVSSATDRLVTLAQELQSEVAKHDNDSSVALDANKAHEIEKLAKSVKDKMQSQ
jgi:hypothetical protein